MLTKTLSLIFRILLISVTLIVAVAELIALFSPSVRPEEGVSLFAILTMVEPFLISANIVLALIWAIMWSPWAFLSLVVALFSLSRIDSYFSYRISRDYSELQSGKQIKKKMRIMSYNVKGFRGNVDTMDSVILTIKEFDPDILCLVEFSALDKVADKFASSLPKLKFHASNKGTKASLSQESGIVLFSRFPLVHATKYEYEGHGVAVAADAVLFYGDTLQLVGLHLESTNYNALSSERELEVYMADSIIDQKGVIGSIRSDTTRHILKTRTLTLARTLSEHSFHRSLQADTVREVFVNPSNRPIVMGDFNDTPYSYSVRKIQGDNLLDPFTLVPKNKYGFTYNMLHKLFRIDFILLHDQSFEVLDYDSPDLGFSDHNPVTVTVRRTY